MSRKRCLMMEYVIKPVKIIEKLGPIKLKLYIWNTGKIILVVKPIIATNIIPMNRYKICVL